MNLTSIREGRREGRSSEACCLEHTTLRRSVAPSHLVCGLSISVPYVRPLLSPMQQADIRAKRMQLGFDATVQSVKCSRLGRGPLQSKATAQSLHRCPAGRADGIWRSDVGVDRAINRRGSWTIRAYGRRRVDVTWRRVAIV